MSNLNTSSATPAVLDLGSVFLRGIVLVLLFVLAMTVVLPLGAGFPSSTRQVVSVWSEIVIEDAEAYSHNGAFAVRDCLRPSPIDCFSVQQNFWISDSSGNLVLWARNSVYLAHLGGTYRGTYSFQVYSQNDRNQPLFCEPESNSSSTCRSPFYVDYSSFPQSLKFYAHISDDDGNNSLQMSNDFGAITWEMPSTAVCPCFIDTVPGPSQPWGSWPFELVAVGIGNTATATFQNVTKGSTEPSLVQYPDGSWHQTSLSAIHCAQLSNCFSMLSTQENSLNLVWDTQRGEFYWMDGAIDQGVHISGIMQEKTEPPTLPILRNETYLYLRFYSTLAYLNVYDELGRTLGIDPQTGRPTSTIPNASLVLSSYVPVKDSPVNAPEEELLILNPQRAYKILVNAGGNTRYSIFLSKTTNTNQILATRTLAGSLAVGDSKSFDLESSDLALSRGTSSFPGILSAVVIFVLLISVVVLILSVLTLRRRRMRRLRPDLDEF